MISYKKVFLKVITFIIVFLIIVYFALFFSEKQAIKEDFSGVVKEINYDAHGNPRVKFSNGDFINLLLFSFDDSPKNIKIGDSLNKKKGSSLLFHYKQNENGIYYLFNKYSH